MAFSVVSALFLATNAVAAPPSEEIAVPPNHTRETPETHSKPPTDVAANSAARSEGSSSSGPVGEKSAWALRPLAIEVQLGVAAPTGGIGVTVDYAVAPSFSVGCGVGTNFIGPEGECRLRLRIVTSREHGVYFGVGISGGPTIQTDSTRLGGLAPLVGPLSSLREDLPPAPQRLSFAKWTNVEFGMETRKMSGFTHRFYFGLALLLNPGDARTPGAGNNTEYSGVVSLNTAMLYIGLGIGAAL